MLSPAEYLPDFLEFLKAPGAESATRLKDCLSKLERRLNWEWPLLVSFEEAASAISLLREPLESLQLLLEQRPESPALPAQAGQVLNNLQRIQLLFNNLPCFTDIGVINDLLVLGARSQGPDHEAVRLRLPLLLQWLDSLELEWQFFLKLWPQRATLQQRALVCIQAMRGAAGALHLELLGEQPGGIKAGLSLLVKALNALEPIEETRFLEESQQCQFSQDLVLERAFRLLDGSDQLPSDYRPLLERWLSDQGHRLQHLHCLKLLKSNQETRLPLLSETLGRLSRSLDSINRELLTEMNEFNKELVGES